MSASNSLLVNAIAQQAATVATSTTPVAADGIPRAAPFSVAGRTVLVTGGGSGIGLSLVNEFVKAGAKTIIITGRREDVLKQAQARFSGQAVSIQYLVSDAGKEADRIALVAEASKRFPELSVVVNNAGIQRRSPLATDTAAWSESQAEIDINFSAPIHLSNLFAPLLLKQKNGAAIIHVTSGLAFVPLAMGKRKKKQTITRSACTCTPLFTSIHAAHQLMCARPLFSQFVFLFFLAPVYSATKAALHSFAISQRISFEGTGVRVVEIAPPAVKSNLGGSHDFGEDADEFAQSVFQRFLNGEQEVGFKISEMFRTKSRVEQIQQSYQFAEHTKTPKYHSA